MTTTILSISHPDTILCVTVVYRPPFAAHNVFINALKQILDKEDINNLSLVIGDFNLAPDSHKYNELTQVFNSLGYQHLDVGPTHISGSTIDHAFLRHTSTNPSVSSRAVPVYYSDHAAVQVTLNIE